MKHLSKTILIFKFLCVFVLNSTLHAQDNTERYWNQFRGPNGDGKASTTHLPIEFSEKQNVRWKTAIHDEGYSSPVVWGNQIWLTTALEDGRELFAICVDLESGDILHDLKVFDVVETSLTQDLLRRVLLRTTL